MSPTPGPALFALDEVMPRYDVSEVHETWVSAPPGAAFAALTELTGREIRLLGPLEAIRGLPHRARGQRVGPEMSRPILEAYRRVGFVELGGQPGVELVLGAVGRFWSLSGNQPLRTIRNRDDFMAFAEPGFAKAAMAFLVKPEGTGSRIVTRLESSGRTSEPRASSAATGSSSAGQAARSAEAGSTPSVASSLAGDHSVASQAARAEPIATRAAPRPYGG